MDASMLFLLPNAPVKCTLNTFTVMLFNESGSNHRLPRCHSSISTLYLVISMFPYAYYCVKAMLGLSSSFVWLQNVLIILHYHSFNHVSCVLPLLWATSGLLYQPQMIGEGDCGAIGGMKIGKGNRSTRRKPARAPLCSLQIPFDQTRDRTWAAALGSQRLTA
jgi:hypothetical protein